MIHKESWARLLGAFRLLSYPKGQRAFIPHEYLRLQTIFSEVLGKSKLMQMEDCNGINLMLRIRIRQ